MRIGRGGIGAGGAIRARSFGLASNRLVRWPGRVVIPVALAAFTASPASASELARPTPRTVSPASTATLTACIPAGWAAMLQTVANDSQVYMHIDCDGTIVVPQTVEIAAGESWSLDAVGHDVTLSGGDVRRLFQVANGASLSLTHLKLEHGYAAASFPGTGQMGSTGAAATGLAPAGPGGPGGTGANGWGIGGGALLNYGSLTATDCVFSFNQARGAQGGSGGMGGVGGAGFAGTYNAGGVGGAGGSGGGGGAALGGAIYNGGTLVLIHDTFTSNLAYGGVGGTGGRGGTGGAGAALTSGGVGGGGGVGGSGGPGGDAQGGAVYSNNALSIAASSFANNQAIGGTGGLGGLGGTGGTGGLGMPFGTYPMTFGGFGGAGGTGGSGGAGGVGGPTAGGALASWGWTQLSYDTLGVNSAQGGSGGFAGSGGSGGAGGDSLCGGCMLLGPNGNGGSGGAGGTPGNGNSASGGAGKVAGQFLEDPLVTLPNNTVVGGTAGPVSLGGNGGLPGQGAPATPGSAGQPGSGHAAGLPGAATTAGIVGTPAAGARLLPATLPEGPLGSPYAAMLAATGGVAPYAWAAIGPMPPGLQLSSAGAIIGTPTQMGTFSFMAVAADSGGHVQHAAATFTLVIGPRGMSTYHPITPIRLLDTRYGNGYGAHLVAGQPITFHVTGRTDASPVIPAGATAVTGNLTVTDPSSGWAVYLGPSPVPSPTTSTTNFKAGQTIANGVTVALSSTGTVSATFMSSGGQTTNLVFDVTGYFQANVTGDVYTPITPIRLVDTRIPKGLSTKLTAGNPACFSVAGSGGLPASVLAVTGNVTVTGSTAPWAVYLGPVSTSTPTTSSVNFGTGEVASNNLTAAVNVAGKLCATYMGPTGATTDLVFDITGYYHSLSTGAGSKFIAINPVRAVDTRKGSGAAGALRAGVPRTFSMAGTYGIPATAVGVTANATVTDETAGWAIFVGPIPTSTPSTSTLNFVPGDVKANGVTVALGSGGKLSATYLGPTNATTHFVFDVTGYFVP